MKIYHILFNKTVQRSVHQSVHVASLDQVQTDRLVQVDGVKVE